MVPGRDAAPPPPPPPGPDAGPPDTAAPPKPACGPVEGRCPTNLPYDFESGTQSFALAESPTASNLRTTCERTYCGSGALAVDASLSYPGPRIVNVERPLGGQNLVGKTVTAHVYVSSFGAPMNGHVYYIDRGGFWKMVTWKVLQPGWNVISAVVNEATADAVKTLGVSAYLAVDNTKWSGKILVDEIGWK
jgi:hypothetical protein